MTNTGGVTHSGAINNVALECALKQVKGKCNKKFGCYECGDCPHYIGRYVDADPRQMELYMYQAKVNAREMLHSAKSANRDARLGLAIVIFVMFVFAWNLTTPGYGSVGRSWFGKFKAAVTNRQTTVQAAPSTLINQTTNPTTTHQHIEAALWQVSRDLANGRDMNGNGKVNCEDAAILFYMHYKGNKNDIRIYANDNPKTGMSHAFNLVLIGDVWRAIEPQAYHLGWHTRGIYFMHDIWGDVYDHTLNINAWNDYGRYVR